MSNIVTIFLAVEQGWSILDVMWVYWFQSVTIGFFNFFRILSLKRFSTNGFRIRNMPVKPTADIKIFTAFFFALHYGFFHLLYAIFLLGFSFFGALFGMKSSVDFLVVLLAAVVFFINHLFSYFYNRGESEGKETSIGAVMFFPYARIIPMHLTIVFGFLQGGAVPLVVFLVLKTIADLIMHYVEHHGWYVKPKAK